MADGARRTCDRSPFEVAIGAFIALALLSSGCSMLRKDQIHYEVRPAQQSDARCEVDAVPVDRILGVGLSGGGSRAAVFGAAALEALAEHGVLGDISHVSSVSGGSLPAAYLLAHPPDCDGLDDDAAEQCRYDYFWQFKSYMRHRYGSWTLLRNSQPWRFSSPTRRVTSLTEVLDNQFLHGKTFGEIGSKPILLINATSYDETRRFVFSNVCLPEGAAETSGSSERYRVMAENALAQRALQAFSFSKPDCARAAPEDMPLSLAVATSAAFPGVLGPASIQGWSDCDGGEQEWWHLGDGGVIENQGIDSLEEVLLRRLADDGPPLQKALFLSVDAGAQSDPEEYKSESNFEMHTDPAKLGLVVDSPRVRGQAYHDMFWTELLDELEKEGIGFEKIVFRYTEAQLEDPPASCAKKLAGGKTMSDLLLDVETKFKIPDCFADLMEMAAHQLVHEKLDDATVRRLNAEGFSIHTARECALAR